MKLSDNQMAHAIAAARKLIQDHSTGFINYSSMVTDSQIKAALTDIIAAIEEDKEAIS